MASAGRLSVIAWYWLPVAFLAGAALTFVTMTRFIGGTDVGKIIAMQNRRIEQLQDDLEMERNHPL
jgi:hypothetical protein